MRNYQFLRRLINKLAPAFVLAFFITGSVYAAPDDLDAGFMAEVGTGFSEPLNAVALEGNGSLLVGGTYGSYKGGTSSAMWRLNADGTVADIIDGFATTTGSPEINSIVVQPDGKILVGGVFDSYDGTSRACVLRLNADLSLDTSFAVAGVGGASVRYVQRLVLADDGKVYVAGNFTTVNGTARPSVARLNTDGSLDTSFAPVSILKSLYYGGYASGTVNDVGIQADGKVVLVGDFDYVDGSVAGHVIRLLPTGAVDTGFNPGTGFDYAANRVFILPDGRILIGGNGDLYDGVETHGLACLMPSGLLDTDFTANLGTGFDGWTGGDLVLGPDGYIYAGGIFTLADDVNTASIAKLSLDGTVQSDFAPTPSQPRGSWGGHTYGIVHQTDGKIVIVGWISHQDSIDMGGPGLQINGTNIYNIARFEGNAGTGPGTVKVVSPVLSIAENNGTVTLSATRINGASGPASVNYATANGSATSGADYTGVSGTLTWADGELGMKSVVVGLLDDAADEGPETFTFTLSGASGASLGEAVTTVTLLDDDSAPGIIKQPEDTDAVAGYAARLSVSTSSVLPVTYQWKKNGVDVPGATGSSLTFTSVSEADAGSYTVAITNDNGTTTSSAAVLSVLTPSGSLDPSFAPGLAAAVAQFAFTESGDYLVVTANGTLSRVDADGLAVSGFTPAAFTRNGGAAIFTSVRELPNGQILVGGTFDTVGGQSIYNLARLNADGSVDATFAPLSASAQPVSALDVDASGNAYIGYSGGDGMDKITTAGAIDGSFSAPAQLAMNSSGAVHKIEVQGDGSLFVSSRDEIGFSNYRYALHRLNADGSAYAGYEIFGTDWYIYDWAALPDGRLAVVGGFDGSYLKGDASVDYKTRLVFIDPETGIVSGTIPTSITNHVVYSAVYHDGFIVMTGEFTSIGGYPHNRIARLRLDGTLNDSLDISTGPNATVRQIDVDENGDFLIAGDFSDFAGSGQGYFARLSRGPGSVGYATAVATVDEDAGTVEFSVVRFGDLSGAASVRWATVDIGDAAAGDDYTSASGTLTWADGDDTPQSFSVTLVNNAQIEDARVFHLELSDASGSLVDRSTLAVTIMDDDTPVSITTDLRDISLVNGSDASLSIQVESPTAVSYQWFKDGSPLPGAPDSPTLELPSFDAGDTGSYYVAITNSAGTVYSEVISVALREPPTDILSPTFASFGSSVNATATDDLGRIYVGGAFSSVDGNSSYKYLARLNADGTLDTTFAPALNNSVSNIRLLPNGDLLIDGNFSTINGTSVAKLARLDADGTLNTTFNTNMIASLSTNAPLAVAVDASGRVYVASSNLAYSFARFSVDGVEDSDYTDNFAVAAFEYPNTNSIALAEDGTVYLGGSYDTTPGSAVTREYLIHLQADGTWDESFDTAMPSLTNIKLQSDGKILVVISNVLRRVNTDGTEDTAFGSVPLYSSFYRQDASGYLYAYERIDSSTYKLHRYTSDGTPDDIFEAASEAVFNSSIYTIEPLADGSLLVGGGFAQYNGTTVNRLVSLRVDQINIDIGEGDLLAEPGSTAVFAATVDGPLPLTYQWYRDGSPLSDGGDVSGAQSRELSIANAEDTDEGEYQFTATRPQGGAPVYSVTRDLVVLGAPEIITEPTGGTLVLGETLTLEVDVQAAAPYTIQWYKDDEALGNDSRISGVTTPTLTITPSQAGDSGSYYAVITNSLDTATSASVSVMVIADPGAVVSGFASSLPASGVLYDVVALPSGKALVATSGMTVNAATRHLLLLNEDGSVDSSFTMTFNNSIEALHMQADGKILVGGSFTTVNGQSGYNRVIRLNSDLTLDTDFTANFASGASNSVTSIATDADGRIYLGGYFYSLNGHNTYYVGRLLADGSADTGFYAPLNNYVFDVVAAGDGVYAGGQFSSTPAYVRKMDGTGATDSGFSPFGLSTIYAMAVQEDGKLLVGTTSQGLVRLNTDGSKDTSFSQPNLSYARAILVRPSGKILVGGAYDGTQDIYYIAQLMPDGTVDPDFDQGTGFDSTVYGLDLSTSGQIWAVGAFTTYNGATYNRVVKLSGEPIALQILDDPEPAQAEAGETVTFTVAATGTTVLSYQWYKDEVELSDGGIISGSNDATLTLDGVSAANAGSYHVVVSNQSGSKTSRAAELVFLAEPEILALTEAQDLDVGETLELSVDSRGAGSLAYQWYKDGVELADGGRISGSTSATLTITDSAVGDTGEYTVRITNNLDTTESETIQVSVTVPPAGMVNGYELPGFNSNVRAVHPLGDGRVLVGGQFTSVTWTANGGGSTSAIRYLALVNADGSIDTSFDPDVSSTVYSIFEDGSGRIYIGGDFTSVAGQTRYRVARFKADLTLDDTFVTSAGPANGSVYTVAVDSDGKVWAGGSFSYLSSGTGSRLIRLNADGSLDTGFTQFPNSNVWEIVPTADGKLYVGGEFYNFQVSGASYLVRLFNDGTVDSSFASTRYSRVYAIALQPDGKVLVGGQNPYIDRMDVDGSDDAGFGTGGNFNGNVWDIAVQPNGKIVAVGDFGTYAGQSSVRMARLTADGSIDAGFELGSALNSSAYAIALEPLGNIWIGGAFSSYQGTNVSRLIRLNGDAVNVAITSQPEVLALESGESGSFSVTAVSASTLTYQWRKNGVDLPGETGSSLTIASASQADEGNYTVAVTDTESGDSVVSDAAEFIFLAGPEILTISDDLQTVVGETVTLSTEARGAATLTYQWQLNGSDLSDDSRISGSTTPMLTISPAELDDNGVYTVIVTNSIDSRTSYGIQLTVIQPPAGLDETWRQSVDTAATTDYDAALNGAVWAILPLDDGGALVAGNFTTMDGTTVNGLTRLDATGDIVPGFVNPGFAANTIRTMALAPDGSVLVGGSFYQVGGESTSSYLVKMSIDGVIDTGYAPLPNNQVNKILMLEDGSHIVVGAFTNIDGAWRSYIARLTAAGELDTAFTLTASSTVFDVAADSTGRLYFGSQGYPVDDGTTNYSYAYFWRTSAAGALDTEYPTSRANSTVEHISVASNDKVYLSGYFGAVGGTTQYLLARLNSDGSKDDSFGAPFNTSYNAYRPYAIQATQDGGVLVSMNYTSLAGVSANRIAKLKEDGSFDTAFDIGTGLNTFARVIEAGPDGRYWIGGDFTTYNGVTVHYLMRLNGYPVSTSTQSAMEAWAVGYGLSGPDALPDADGDADGMPLLLEFVLGADPTASDVPGDYTSLGSSSGSSLHAVDAGLGLDEAKTYVTFTARVRRDRGDVTVVPQACTDLDFNAQTPTATAQQVGSPVADGDFDIITYVATPALEDISGSNPTVFFRLQVTQ